MNVIISTLAALVFTTSIAAAQLPSLRSGLPTGETRASHPRTSQVAPAQKAGVHKTLNQLEKGALKGVFGDQKAFAAKLAKAMNGDTVVASPR